MFITFVINTEYMDNESRMKWYLKNLLFCKEYEGVCITHQNLIDNFGEYQKRVGERFLSEFEIRYFNEQEFSSIKQYAIEDSVFSQIEKQCGSRSAEISHLLGEDDFLLHKSLDRIFHEMRDDFPNENIEMAFHCLNAYKSITDACERYNVPLISYTFSCMRKVHGYRQTLYIAAIDKPIYCTDDGKIRYDKFCQENNNFPILNNKEIIALLGKSRTLPLTLLMDKEPSHEIAICGEAFAYIPSVYYTYHYDDDDVYYYIGKIYKQSQTKTRQHPYLLGHMQIPKDHFMQDDPASFILSCKRTTSVASQIMLKTMLWGRTPVMPKDTLPLAFQCATKYDEIKVTDLKFLNYYLFCYMVPSSLMFDADYWRWRMTKPSEAEIYIRHLKEILKNVECYENIFNKKDDIFWDILATRKSDNSIVENMKSFVPSETIDWNAATSKVVLKYIDKPDETIWVANNFKNGEIKSRFIISDNLTLKSILFFAIDDRATYIKVERTLVNDTPVVVSTKCEYTDKHCPSVVIDVSEITGTISTLTVFWNYDDSYSGSYK